MAQHQMKKKVSLPVGTKTKGNRINKKANAPKKGITVAPKKASAVADAKLQTLISRTVNHRNEEMIKTRADKEQGRSENKPKKTDKKKKA
uniref:UPF0390 protein n=1 Tax=Rhabditophanes sp. KR3021 TaxID=114890 RepID=A0AC35U7S2_9BILA